MQSRENTRFRWLVIFAAISSLGLCGASEDPPAKKPRLTDVAFMVGAWESGETDSPARETWGPPVGGAIVGMAHLGSGRSAVYEMEVIEERDDGVFLFTEHFRPGLVRRDKEAVKFKLIETGPRRAVFEEIKPEHPARLSYTSTGENKLTARVEHFRDGKSESFEFPMTRAK